MKQYPELDKDTVSLSYR